MATAKLPIEGTATLDQPGVFVTRAGVLRYAKSQMPRDLKRAGFGVSIIEGREIHDGKYRNCWRINYGKTIAKNPITRKTPAKQIRRTNVTANQYVKRPSQATRKTSSKRLRARHVLNKPGSGRFPNPIKYTDQANNLRGERKVAYAIHWPDKPSYHAIAYFSKKADAIDTAKELATRYRRQVAVSRVQIYFGPD